MSRVAFVVGVAFNAVVLSFANDIVMGFIGAIFGKPNFNNVAWNIGSCKVNEFNVKVCQGTVAYGAFITAVVNFLIVALAVFIFIKTFEKLQHLARAGGARARAADAQRGAADRDQGRAGATAVSGVLCCSVVSGTPESPM